MREVFEDVIVTSPVVKSVLAHIRQKLIRDVASVVPYKLNVYGPGGFFKPHVDTPSLSAARMVGTAVVALPSAFAGGALRVRAAAGHLPVSAPGTPTIQEVIYDWGAPADTSLPADALSCSPAKLPWAAFFGDCVHEVLPVTAGHRVTITFGIIADVEGPDDEASEDASVDDTEGGSCSLAGPPAAAVTVATAGAGVPAERNALAAAGAAGNIARILAAVDARPAAAATFGILLSHKYTLGAVSVGQLKGADSALHAALLASGSYSLALRPVAYHYHHTGQYPGDSEPAVYTHTVHAFGAPELSALRKVATSNSGSDSEDSTKDSEGEDGSAGQVGEAVEDVAGKSSEDEDSEGGPVVADARIPFVRFFSPDEYVPSATPGALLKHYSLDEAEHTGNEARAGEDDYIYFSVALIVSPRAAPAAPAAVAEPAPLPADADATATSGRRTGGRKRFRGADAAGKGADSARD